MLFQSNSKRSFQRFSYVICMLLAVVLLSTGCAPGVSSRLARVEHYDLSVTFDTTAHKLTGEADLTFSPKPGDGIGFMLNPEFSIEKATIGGEKVTLLKVNASAEDDSRSNEGIFEHWNPDRAALWFAEVPEKVLDAGEFTMNIAYAGSLYTPPDDREFSREKIAFEVSGTISSNGIYLSPSAYWYPWIPDNLATHRTTTMLPKGWNCVTTGDPSWTENETGVTVIHDSTVPLDGLNFSAAPFEIKEVEHSGVRIMTYFLPAQADLADGYLNSCKGYVDMYSEMIGTYPFPKFAVVDNFLPSGYGMPGWTLLGSEVLRLPFIKYTSLGHEVLHNWFGNSLYVDYDQGNWCEGLTAYLADHKYKMARGPAGGIDYRLNTLRDYANYVKNDNDYPVTEFISRVDSHDRAIGYGKVLMIFHMLNKMFSAEDGDMFRKMISEVYQENQWKVVSWTDWQNAAEKHYGRDLDWYFDQWVKKAGAPTISAQDVEITQNETGWIAKFNVVTEPAGESFQYPLIIRSTDDSGKSSDEFKLIRNNNEMLELSGSGKLAKLHLDPDFDTCRMIYPGEMPTTIAAFYGDAEGVLVVPSRGRNMKEWKKVAEGLKKHGQKVVTENELTDEMKQKSLWFFAPSTMLLEEFGVNEDVFRINRAVAGSDIVIDGFNLNGEVFEGGEKTATAIFPHPQMEGKTIVYTVGLPHADPVAGTRKLPHYGKYSFLLFEGDTNISKGILPPKGDNPLVWTVGE